MKQGNIIIERDGNGYFLTVKDELTENRLAVTEQELFDIKECINQMDMHGEIEESKEF